MRSYEFITETITIADYQEQFEKVITDSIKSSIMSLVGGRGTFENETKANNTDSIEPLLTGGYMRRFWLSLHKEIIKNLSEVVTQLFNQRYKNNESLIDMYSNRTIRIEKLRYHGYATGLQIVLSDQFITDIDNTVRDILRNNYLDLIDSDYNDHGKLSTTDKFFRAIKSLSRSPEIILEDYKIIDLIVSLAEVTTHELVHVFQHAEQYKKNQFATSTEYRSYAEKDKGKFHKIVNRLGTPESEPADYGIYQASPQEIAAFSHNIANKIIKDFDLFQYPNNIDQDQYYDIIQSYVFEHLRYTVEQRNNMNYIERKVFNRYAKQIYQIVRHYLEKRHDSVNKD